MSDDKKQGNESDLEQRLMSAFNNLAGKQGSADAAGVLLLQENKEYRDKIKELERQLADVKKNTPAEDSLVLSVDEAKLWLAYKELGTPDDLSSNTHQYKALQRDSLIRQAAEAHQYKPSVLSQLAGDLSLEIKEVEADGKKAQAAYVRVDDKEMPLTDYAQSNWADFMPALQATTQTSTSFVKQEPGTKGTAKSTVEQWREQKRKAQEEQKNPLMR